MLEKAILSLKIQRKIFDHTIKIVSVGRARFDSKGSSIAL